LFINLQRRIPYILEHKIATLISGTNEAHNTRRSQRLSFPSTRLTDHEVLADRKVGDTGKLVHLAFLDDA